MSRDHRWNGAKANLINKLKIIKDKPHSKILKLNKLTVADILYKFNKLIIFETVVNLKNLYWLKSQIEVKSSSVV